ncbi:hypothetical protein AB4Z32_20845 [Massilia sp. 2TAF26]|uniref:hypothetical protein n=1 Tax=Massilia sp. 2TAF26 TaxID=3233012 RepID=UPI003F9E6BD4
MQDTMASPAFSSAEYMRDIALQVMRMSEAIHHTLRQLTSTSSADQSTSPYALLTEEYALRARANMLLIEAARLARPDFPVTQGAVLEILKGVEAQLSRAGSLEELSDLVVALLLFTSSIISRRNQVISTLLQNLDDTVVVA